MIAPGNDRERPLRRRLAEQRLCRVLDGVVAPRADGDPPWLCGLGQGKGQFQHAVVAVGVDVLPASTLDWDIVQLRRELDCESSCCRFLSAVAVLVRRGFVRSHARWFNAGRSR